MGFKPEEYDGLAAARTETRLQMDSTRKATILTGATYVRSVAGISQYIDPGHEAADAGEHRKWPRMVLYAIDCKAVRC